MKLKTILKIIYINFKIIFKQYFLKNAYPTPYKALIQLTNDCNSKCKSCHIWKINIQDPALKATELNPEQYELFLKTSGSHLYWLSFSGGEISLYDNFDKLIKLISLHCPKLAIITFTTNGLMPEKILLLSKMIKESLPQCDFFVTISLDGNKETHDKIRGIPGNYELAILTQSLLKKIKINTYFGITVSHMNNDFIMSLEPKGEFKFKAINLIHDGGIYNRSLNPAKKNVLKSLIKIKKLYKIRSLGEFIEFIFIKLSITFLKHERAENLIPCEVINTSIHITPYGDVMPCMFMPSLGNIKEQSIQEILSSKKTKIELENIKNNKCPKCWMNCYAPHSMMRHPFKTLRASLLKN